MKRLVFGREGKLFAIIEFRRICGFDVKTAYLSYKAAELIQGKGVMTLITSSHCYFF